MSTPYLCGVCNIVCTGQAPYDQHMIGASHAKKARLLSSQASTPTTLPTRPPNNPTLETSPAPPSSSSSSVSISAETMRLLLEWNHPLGYDPYCSLCQLPLHGGNNADLHFDASNILHQEKRRAVKQIHETNPAYSCKFCLTIFSNENAMYEHLHSDEHSKLMLQNDNLQKFILIYQTYKKLKQARKANLTDDDSLQSQFSTMQIGVASEPSSTLIFKLDQLQSMMAHVKNENDD